VDLPRPIAFVLGGGASLGAVQVGMLQALAEDRLEPDLVVGASVGAINGALLAEDPAGAANRLVHFWAQVTRQEVFPGSAVDLVRALHRRRNHLVAPDGLRDLLGRVLVSERIEDLPLPFTAVATDLLSGDLVALRSGPLVDSLLASAAVPGLYPPVRIGGRELVDGGVNSNIPVRAALSAGAGSIVVLDCGLFGFRSRPPRGLPEMVTQALAIMLGQQAARDIPAAAAEVPVLYLPGPFPVTGSPLEFADSARLMQEAYEETRRFLAQVEPRGPGLYGEPHLRSGQQIEEPHAPDGERAT